MPKILTKSSKQCEIGENSSNWPEKNRKWANFSNKKKRLKSAKKLKSLRSGILVYESWYYVAVRLPCKFYNVQGRIQEVAHPGGQVSHSFWRPGAKLKIAPSPPPPPRQFGAPEIFFAGAWNCMAPLSSC